MNVGTRMQIDLELGTQRPAEGRPATISRCVMKGQIIPPETGEYTLTVQGAAGDFAKLEIRVREV